MDRLIRTMYDSRIAADSSCSRRRSTLNVVERSLRVEGRHGLGMKPKPELIGPLLSDLHESLQDAVRMGFLHSSRARGRVRTGLKHAADIRFIGHEGAGSEITILHFELPPFGTAAPDFFRQTSFWDDQPSPDDTAIELLGSALNDVGARKADSSRFDPPLLSRISRYSRILQRGIDRVSLVDAALPSVPRIDADVVEAASQLAAVTPGAQRVRVAGRLDLMGASERVLKIEVRPGEFVTVLWEQDEPVEAFHELFNKDVVIEGLAVFRPSGTVLRIDADLIAPASAQEDFFRQVPRAVVPRDYDKATHLRPGERSAYLQLRGCVPAGDNESDADFEAALAALR